MERYPQLVIATKNLQHNFNCLKEMCRPYGIRITAVTKGFTSVPEACQALQGNFFCVNSKPWGCLVLTAGIMGL